jgi:hypothetical protein
MQLRYWVFLVSLMLLIVETTLFFYLKWINLLVIVFLFLSTIISSIIVAITTAEREKPLNWVNGNIISIIVSLMIGALTYKIWGFVGG